MLDVITIENSVGSDFRHIFSSRIHVATCPFGRVKVETIGAQTTRLTSMNRQAVVWDRPHYLLTTNVKPSHNQPKQQICTLLKQGKIDPCGFNSSHLFLSHLLQPSR